MLYDALPLRYKKPAQVTLDNQLLSRTNTTDLVCQDQPFSLALYKSAGIISEVKYCVLTISVGTHNTTLAVNAEHLLAWASKSFPVSSFYLLPDPVVKVVIEKTLSPLWQWLEKAFDQPVSLNTCKITPGSTLTWQNKHTVSLCLSEKANHEEQDNIETPALNCLLIEANTHIIDAMINAFPPYSCDNKTLQTIRWPVSLSYGVTTLTLKQIRALEKGDIVFFERTSGEHCVFGYINPSLRLTCKLESPETLLVEKIETIPMNDSSEKKDLLSDDLISKLMADHEGTDDDFLNNLLRQNDAENTDEQIREEKNERDMSSLFSSMDMDDNDPEETVETETVKQAEEETLLSQQKFNTDTLSVPVHFGIGSAMITLESLKKLRKGFCFELPENTHDYITLKVHDQDIGKGELVRVGDRLGVEITEIYGEKE